MYREINTQFGRYIGHVTKNIGGIYETPKTVEQEGGIYENVPKAIQQEAVQFLNKQLFTTPKWLLDKDILSRTGNNPITVISARQNAVLDRVMSATTLTKLISAEATDDNAYQATALLNDFKKGIFSELATHQSIDVYRRNLQKSYVQHLADLMSAPDQGNNSIMLIMTGQQPTDATKTDVSSIARAQLVSLRTEIRAATAGMTDNMSRYHLSDLTERINHTLDPK
jgi:hypothetical protein